MSSSEDTLSEKILDWRNTTNQSEEELSDKRQRRKEGRSSSTLKRSKSRDHSQTKANGPTAGDQNKPAKSVQERNYGGCFSKGEKAVCKESTCVLIRDAMRVLQHTREYRLDYLARKQYEEDDADNDIPVNSGVREKAEGNDRVTGSGKSKGMSSHVERAPSKKSVAINEGNRNKHSSRSMRSDKVSNKESESEHKHMPRYFPETPSKHSERSKDKQSSHPPQRSVKESDRQSSNPQRSVKESDRQSSNPQRSAKENDRQSSNPQIGAKESDRLSSNPQKSAKESDRQSSNPQTSTRSNKSDKQPSNTSVGSKDNQSSIRSKTVIEETNNEESPDVSEAPNVTEASNDEESPDVSEAPNVTEASNDGESPDVSETMPHYSESPGSDIEDPDETEGFNQSDDETEDEGPDLSVNTIKNTLANSTYTPQKPVAETIVKAMLPIDHYSGA